MDAVQMDIKLRPQDDRTNGWSAILPARRAHATLRQRVDADWLIIGAGYAGLAAARRLAHAEPFRLDLLRRAGRPRPRR